MTVHTLPVTRSVASTDALRSVVVTGLAVTAAVHVPVAAEHVQAAHYLLLSFDLLVVGCAALAALLALRPSRPLTAAATLLCLGALAAYVVSRSVGLPLDDDDVGDWTNPAGVAALVAELSVVVSGVVLMRRRRL